MEMLGALFDIYAEVIQGFPLLDELLERSVVLFVIVQVICAAGLFSIFSRMNAKRWPAAIPVSGIYWLGELIQRRVAAVFIVISKLLILLSCAEYMLATFRELDVSDPMSIQFWGNDWPVVGLCMLAVGVALLIRFIAGLFLYSRLCGKFGVSKWWLVPFSVAPYITMLFWSMNSKVRDSF